MLRVRSPSFQEVSNVILNAVPRDRDTAIQMLQTFVTSNEDPGRSANFKSTKPDRMDTIIKALRQPDVSQDSHMVLLLLKSLKILSRKHDNRLNAGVGSSHDTHVRFITLDRLEFCFLANFRFLLTTRSFSCARGVEDIRIVLDYQRNACNCRIGAEAANVLLNLCYERRNVESVISCGGVPPLLDALSSDEVEMQANAAGAIQSICFQDVGRKSIRGTGGILQFVKLLDSEHTKVRLRSVGAVHNVSSDPKAIQIIRHNGGIPKLVRMLRSPHVSIKGSAAGALQNLSREIASRIVIRDLDAVGPLSDLLSADDTQAQVCAAGALLNLLGPELATKEEKQREGLGKIVSLILSVSIMFQGLEEAFPLIV
ncbi:hypothetical protein BSKO_12500 [Bryopsis sp. KO-2023]|nr:hypothetical protein BSKO_12500 [Bryopsis sp. KO-2023]